MNVPPVLIRYCDDQFDSESSTATIGVDFKVSSQRLRFRPILMMVKLKKLSVHGKAYRLNLLDTAGQERFRTLSNSYYRGAHGIILVYDISSRESFLSMEKWYEEVEDNAMPGAIMCLVCIQSLTPERNAPVFSFMCPGCVNPYA